jgi:hypothetical protein
MRRSRRSKIGPTLLTSTSFEHLAAFAIFGALFSLAYPWQVALVCLIVLGSAVLLEILQLQTPESTRPSPGRWNLNANA